MERLTFLQIAELTLEKARIPLSPKEIWEKANEFELTKNFKTSGKTPWQTIGAQIYTEINKNNDKCVFIQTSTRPVKFYLTRLYNSSNIQISKKDNKSAVEGDKKKGKFDERDLHPILVTYTYADPHFKAHLKTIFHENSRKGKKGLNEWLHPDLVGVYFPYKDYKEVTLEIQSYLSISSLKLFSFEVKIELNFGNLRHNYFQAVSNSSWAHEGYLVVLKIDDDPTFKDEIRRLNNAFGIGVIKLNPENVHESEILFPSNIKPEIDWDTVNRLAMENSDFNKFLKDLTEDIKIGKVKSDYDKTMPLEEIKKYIKTKKIY